MPALIPTPELLAARADKATARKLYYDSSIELEAANIAQRNARTTYDIALETYEAMKRKEYAILLALRVRASDHSA